MKKLFCLVLALLMLFSSAAFAEPVAVDENAALTREEIALYLDSLVSAALAEGSFTTEENGVGMIEVMYSGALLVIADEQLTETTAVVSAFLEEETADLRGLSIGSSLEEVLAAYPNDNPNLAGTYYDAVLFITGEKPEMSVGYLLRDGQRVTNVVYDVYSWQPEGVSVSQVIYRLDNGYVTDIMMFADGMTDEAEVLQSVQELADMQEISEYFAYPVSVDKGEALAPFEREDLKLLVNAADALDFLDLTAEELIAVLGAAPVD